MFCATVIPFLISLFVEIGFVTFGEKFFVIISFAAPGAFTFAVDVGVGGVSVLR